MATKNFSLPYKASFANRYFDWVDGLPIPTWLYYVLLYIASTLLALATFRLSGNLPAGDISPAVFVGGIWWVMESATIHYLDHVGRSQMQKFRPLIKSQSDYDDLAYRIHRMPARRVNILTGLLAIVMILVAILSPDSLVQSGSSGLTLALGTLLTFIAYLTSPIYLYHAMHQLSVVRQAYKKAAKIELFNLGSLRSLSRISALTGSAVFILLILNVIQNVILVEGSGNLGGAIAITILFVFVTSLAFVLPLRDVQARIRAQKARALNENGQLIQSVIDELQAHIRAGKASQVASLGQANAALTFIRDEIKGVSPWPWEADTFRAFLSAILLPIFLIISQQIISRIF